MGLLPHVPGIRSLALVAERGIVRPGERRHVYGHRRPSRRDRRNVRPEADELLLLLLPLVHSNAFWHDSDARVPDAGMHEPLRLRDLLEDAEAREPLRGFRPLEALRSPLTPVPLDAL